MSTDALDSRSATAARHAWRFYRAGGLQQVFLETAEDFANLDQLDQKLWVALSCPVMGIDLDERTLRLIDSDGDGRIRVPEVIKAVHWTRSHLRDMRDIVAGSDLLPLAAIDDRSDSGKQILASARQILANLGKGETKEISVGDTSDTVRIFAQSNANGDGIVPADAAPDAESRLVIEQIIATCGTVNDRSGKPGIDQPTVNRFFGELQAFADWWSRGENSADAAVLMPLGAQTQVALAALDAVRAKVNDYFARCRLAAFDPRAAAPLNRGESDFATIATMDLSVLGPEVAALPLAHIEAGQPLPLDGSLNPAWADAMEAFRTKAVVPLLGGDRTSLTEAEWRELMARLAPYEQWVKGKAGAAVESLGIVRIRQILAGNSREIVTGLIASDLAMAPQMNAIESVDRLTRYHRDLYRLLTNFVSFSDFYSLSKQATFQAGTLYIDARSCDLCMIVDDANKHSTLAAQGNVYIAYCECSRHDEPKKLIVAAAITNGDADYMSVGRNGIYYDLRGRDWDARVIKIIDHPLSIRQAFFSPYKRFAKMIGEQINKLAAAREKAVEAKASTGIESAAKAVDAPKPATPAAAEAPKDKPLPFDIAKTVGIFAAIGLAIGAIGTALAALVKAFIGLPWYQQPLAILAILIVISGPSVILTWMKLRQRTLGPVLDASYWAINGRVKINSKLGRVLTKLAKLPPGSKVRLADPFAPRRRAFWTITVLIVLAAGGWYWYRWHKAQEAKAAQPPAAIVAPASDTSPAQ